MAEGRGVLVTGAAGRIGAAIARAFADESARVAAIDRDPLVIDLAGPLATPGLACLAPQAAASGGYPAWYPRRFMEPIELNEPWLSSALERVGAVLGRIEAAGIPAELHGHQGVYRLGLGYPLSSFPTLEATADEVRRAAKGGKELGFNGALCWAPSWVEPCNRGFTPTDEEVAYHQSVREAYQKAVAMGRGAMAFEGGKFVERPVDELAKKILALRAQCDQRDAEKAAARADLSR
jgi:NAD(P)-dependent dehydrogenase (short-subunit alcohol dehydrogenase family)